MIWGYNMPEPTRPYETSFNHEKHGKDYPFQGCSDRKCTDEEFNKLCDRVTILEDVIRKAWLAGMNLCKAMEKPENES